MKHTKNFLKKGSSRNLKSNSTNKSFKIPSKDSKKSSNKNSNKDFSKKPKKYCSNNNKNSNNKTNNNNNNKDGNKYQCRYKNEKSEVKTYNLLDNYNKYLINSSNLIKISNEIRNIQYIRINPKIDNNTKSNKSEEEIVHFLEKKLRIKLEKTFLPLCYKVKKSFFSISGSISSLCGDIYIQDLASQLPVNILDFSRFKNKDIKILDMCSSPGSKTTQMIYFLNKFNIDYEIYANELQQNRLKQLSNNIQKNNSSKIKILCSNALDLNFKNEFDIIFLDAPCSGNLILDRNWLQKRDKKGILENSSLQKKLLKKAKEMCKKDGYISYSTCSMEYEENEENVLYGIDKLKLVSIDDYSTQNWTFPFIYKSIDIVKHLKNDTTKSKKLQHSIRIHPPLSNSQGFFITIFQNK